jgi:aromatic ring-opening dioxygenase LigB subunit
MVQRLTHEVHGGPQHGRNGLVIAAIAPHGGIVIEELCPPELAGRVEAIRAAMEEMGHRFAAARPQTIVVLTPHHVHVPGAIAVATAAIAAGQIEENHRQVRLRCTIDRQLASTMLTMLRLAGVSAVGVDLGPEAEATGAALPMDWGTLVPLWFLARGDPTPKVVIVSPSPELTPSEHVRAGVAIARAAAVHERTVALVASADQGHAHDPDGPYGFHPASREYDQLVVRLVEEDRLGALLLLDPALVERAKADSWWQLLMLHGALGSGWRGRLLAYEVPTYFGMLCALYEPIP